MLPFLVAGIAIGSVHALSAVGLVLLYRTTGTLNVGYGAMGAIGAIVSWELLDRDAVSLWPALLVGVAITTLLSTGWGMTVARRLADEDPLVGATATVGFVLIAIGATSLYWNDDPRRIRLPTDTMGFRLSTTRVTGTQLLACGLGITVAAVATIALRRTRFGTQMRALSHDRQLSSMLGVRVRLVDTAAWAICGVIAGMTALLLASMTTLSIPNLTFMVIPAIAVALIGGMRSFWLALLGGFAVGVLQAFATYSSRFSSYSDAVPFAVAALVTLWYGRHKIYEIRTSA